MSNQRARISDSRANAYMDLIATQNTIIREIQAIITDLDPDTLGYHRRRFSRIIHCADSTKKAIREQWEREAQAALNGRQSAD